MGVSNSRGVPSQSVEAWWGWVEPSRLRNATAASWMHPVNVNQAGAVQGVKKSCHAEMGSQAANPPSSLTSDDAGAG